MSAIGIIGGTGVYDPSIFENIHEESLMTPYGEIDYVQGTYHGKTVIFVARHGKDHTIPPHKINYRANIWGLKKLGVTFIISTTAVGSLNENFKPGHFVLTDQFLDFTKNRITTFYEGGDRPVAHLDVTNPYCPELRDILPVGWHNWNKKDAEKTVFYAEYDSYGPGANPKHALLSPIS